MTTSLHDWTERGHNVTFAIFPSESMCTPRLLPAFYLFLWRACPNTRSYLKCSTNPGGRVVWLQCEQFMLGTWNLSINNPLCQNLHQHPVARNVVKLSSSPIVDQEGEEGARENNRSSFQCENGFRIAWTRFLFYCPIGRVKYQNFFLVAATSLHYSPKRPLSNKVVKLNLDFKVSDAIKLQYYKKKLTRPNMRIPYNLLNFVVQ